MDHIDRKGMRPSRAATNRKTGYLSEMIKMYPTPNSNDGATNPSEDIENWEKRAEKKKKEGINLHYALRHAVQKEEQMKMYPTPRASIGMNFSMTTKLAKWHKKKYLETEVAYRNQKNLDRGGRLNPNFVEFLMGYPSNYTQIEPTESKHSETQSCHKSQNKSSGVS
tara:strand:- start:84 stop:584 length:501 start_codon:yes stop_codon:yes gene_type:complete